MSVNCGCSPQQSPQQHRIDAAAKANLAVDLDDWHALVKPLAQRLIGVDVDQSAARFPVRRGALRPPRRGDIHYEYRSQHASCWLIVLKRMSFIDALMSAATSLSTRASISGLMFTKQVAARGPQIPASPLLGGVSGDSPSPGSATSYAFCLPPLLPAAYDGCGSWKAAPTRFDALVGSPRRGETEPLSHDA